MSKLRRWLVGVLRRDQFEAELEEEIRFHLEMKADEQLFPYLQPQQVRRVRTLLVQTEDPGAALPAVRRVLGELEASAEVEIKTMRDHLSRAYWPSRIGAFVLGGLGLVGLVLTTVGLYGVLSYAVNRRTSEIGVRMALGASRQAVVRLVVRDGLVLVGIGAALGTALALAATRPLQSFLAANVSASDPASFTAALLLTALIGAAASFLPAYRAATVEPMKALRHE
jgi:ABC-type antimicrobial peptide transport system permease subunit